LPPEKIELQLRELQDRWSDSARLQGFLVEAVRTKQKRIGYLERRLARVRSVVASAHRLQAGERLDGIFDKLR
jgi:nucleoside-triphosphatase THEP1